jgi:hypothetical protein
MADKINDGGPVYPCRVTPKIEDVRAFKEAGDFGLLQARELAANHTGMSLRDAAALAALQGFCTQSDSSGTWTWPPDTAVAEAWRVADAFIAAREGKTDDQ